MSAFKLRYGPRQSLNSRQRVGIEDIFKLGRSSQGRSVVDSLDLKTAVRFCTEEKVYTEYFPALNARLRCLKSVIVIKYKIYRTVKRLDGTARRRSYEEPGTVHPEQQL